MVHTLQGPSALVNQNDAKETGGNLDAQSVFQKQLIDLLKQNLQMQRAILFQLQLLNGTQGQAFDTTDILAE